MSIGTDIALIGFDEIEILDILSPNVSVVSRPTKQMGTVAAEILLDRFKKPAAKQGQLKRITLSPKLILKGSERMVKTS
jgi:LacI family transcriptional regulator